MAPPAASACLSTLRTAASTSSGRTGLPATCSVRSDGSWPASMDGLGQCEYVRPPRRSGWYLYYGANATDNITLLRTLAGAGGTGYDRSLHVSIVVRIVRRRGIVLPPFLTNATIRPKRKASKKAPSATLSLTIENGGLSRTYLDLVPPRTPELSVLRWKLCYSPLFRE